MPVLLLLVLGPLVILLLPVLLPVVALQQAWEARQLRAAARASRCCRCGCVLGPEALGHADARWSAHMAALRQAHPHAILRVVRRLRALCPRCGAQHGFMGNTRQFFLLLPDYQLHDQPEVEPGPGPGPGPGQGRLENPVLRR